MTARNPIEERIRDTERPVARTARTDALNGVLANRKRLGRQLAEVT